jgi:hypothetical protein
LLRIIKYCPAKLVERNSQTNFKGRSTDNLAALNKVIVKIASPLKKREIKRLL